MSWEESHIKTPNNNRGVRHNRKRLSDLVEHSLRRGNLADDHITITINYCNRSHPLKVASQNKIGHRKKLVKTFKMLRFTSFCFLAHPGLHHTTTPVAYNIWVGLVGVGIINIHCLPFPRRCRRPTIPCHYWSSQLSTSSNVMLPTLCAMRYAMHRQ